MVEEKEVIIETSSGDWGDEYKGENLPRIAIGFRMWFNKAKYPSQQKSLSNQKVKELLINSTKK